eukprot:CAMPEP_0175506274 /NCGR_PEP_ID=MMETSP0096-20121207/9270_1 /TAXON_ID=311494 /ORGANISM="Alexandrium monilatum, Strain CCMP3105" /LENGTH=453 /DNA_ID=CAMNT_0016808377 /DNA_START=36 /DNA_END=1393 /DNA_ORIENTATION=+
MDETLKMESCENEPAHRPIVDAHPHAKNGGPANHRKAEARQSDYYESLGLLQLACRVLAGVYEPEALCDVEVHGVAHREVEGVVRVAVDRTAHLPVQERLVVGLQPLRRAVALAGLVVVLGRGGRPARLCHPHRVVLPLRHRRDPCAEVGHASWNRCEGAGAHVVPEGVDVEGPDPAVLVLLPGLAEVRQDLGHRGVHERKASLGVAAEHGRELDAPELLDPIHVLRPPHEGVEVPAPAPEFLNAGVGDALLLEVQLHLVPERHGHDILRADDVYQLQGPVPRQVVVGVVAGDRGAHQHRRLVPVDERRQLLPGTPADGVVAPLALPRLEHPDGADGLVGVRPQRRDVRHALLERRVVEAHALAGQRLRAGELQRGVARVQGLGHGCRRRHHCRAGGGLPWVITAPAASGERHRDCNDAAAQACVEKASSPLAGNRPRGHAAQGRGGGGRSQA